MKGLSGIATLLCLVSSKDGIFAEEQGLHGHRFLQNATVMPSSTFVPNSTFVPSSTVAANSTLVLEAFRSNVTSASSTTAPTPLPTTGAPTARTTGSPTAAATTKKTPSPTAASTSQATPSPTKLPRASPTPLPTTPAPKTPAPTRAPIAASKTYSPTHRPTPKPTARPASAPNRAPSKTQTAPTTPVSNASNGSNGSLGSAGRKPRSMTTTIIIAVAASVGGLLLILLIFFIFKRRKNSEANKNNDGKASANTRNSPELFIPNGYDEEISTLGDPAGLEGRHRNKFADDARSMNTEKLDQMLDSNTTYPGTAPILVDPGECFDVRAPPGKLGVMLEEVSAEDVPIVYALKRGSALDGKVQKGDRLCSVDGIDCTGKSPHDVGELLKFKENTSSRILTFTRPNNAYS